LYNQDGSLKPELVSRLNEIIQDADEEGVVILLVLFSRNVCKAGGYAIYHHDMFQTGYGSADVPPNGIPLPGFSDYHDKVFEFLKYKERYLKVIR